MFPNTSATPSGGYNPILCHPPVGAKNVSPLLVADDLLGSPLVEGLQTAFFYVGKAVGEGSECGGFYQLLVACPSEEGA